MLILDALLELLKFWHVTKAKCESNECGNSRDEDEKVQLRIALPICNILFPNHALKTHITIPRRKL